MRMLYIICENDYTSHVRVNRVNRYIQLDGQFDTMIRLNKKVFLVGNHLYLYHFTSILKVRFARQG